VLPELFFGLREFGVMVAAEFSPTAPVVAAVASPMHPDFFLAAVTPWNAIDNADVALHILERNLSVRPARLPPAGLLDHLGKTAPLTIVGYGIVRPDASWSDRGTRMFGQVRLAEKWAGVFGTSPAGSAVCFGDSGGPLLHGAKAHAASRQKARMILGISLNGDCAGWSMHYRLDTPQARAFLGQYLELPGADKR
jgi:hypothetical protein